MINIFIINIASQTQRLQRTRQRIAELGLTRAQIFTICAITPRNLISHWYAPGVKFKSRELSAAEIACASSHIKALKAAALARASCLWGRFFIKNPEQMPAKFAFFLPACKGEISLILEDDVKFYPKAAQILEKISQISREEELKCEILLLGHHLQLYADDGFLIPTPIRRRSLRKIFADERGCGGHFFAEHAGMSVGAYCYVVGICGARKLIGCGLPITRPADWLTHNNPQIHALFAAPALAFCEHESSSTKSDFSRKKRSKISKYFKYLKFQIRYFLPKYF